MKHALLAVFSVILIATAAPGNGAQETKPMSPLSKTTPTMAPPKGMSVCFGGDVGEAQYRQFKSLGVTSAETYVTWAGSEPEKDKWDWSNYDTIAGNVRKAGLKWVPFLIVGPSYATPAWYKKSSEAVFARCLEHDENSDIQSIWNPNLLPWVDRYLGAFAERYNKGDFIESVLLGISGNYGEAIMIASGNDWSCPKDHTHPGWWCGDRYAVADFREFLRKKYSKIETLNAAWKSSCKSFQEIHPVLPGKADSERAWLDQHAWYQGSMDRWADQWMALARKHFPNTQLYLCTGGIAQREHASNFSTQCKIAAKYNAGVRITNEASDYSANFFLTRWVATAGKHYGAFYGFEPAGSEDENGIRARIYNVTASGAVQYHTYHNNVTDTAARTKSFQDHYRYLRPAKPVVDVAVFIPRTWQVIYGDDLWHKVQNLRDITDADLVDEQLIRDGALKHYKALILLSGNVVEAEDLKRIDAWIESGGKLLVSNFGRIRTVEGDTSIYDKWGGMANGSQVHSRRIGKGTASFCDGDWSQRSAFFEMVREALSKLPGRIESDGEADGVYATVLKDAVLYLNTTDKPVDKTLHLANGSFRRITVPANTIHEERW